MSDTTKVYEIDDLLRLGSPECSIKTLRKLARRIWSTYCGRVPCPAVVAGRGMKRNNSLLSYSEGGRVVLSRNMRNRVMLCHELAHELGPSTHGWRFQNLYADLLDRYSGISR